LEVEKKRSFNVLFYFLQDRAGDSEG